MNEPRAKILVDAFKKCGIHAEVKQSAVVDFCVSIPNGVGEIRIASDGIEQYDDQEIDSCPFNKIRFRFHL